MVEVFVGRDRELLSLVTLLDRAREGSGNVAMIVGEPGIGKTNLARQLASTARERGALVLEGRCHERDLGAPLAPWRAILSEVVERVSSEHLEVSLGPLKSVLAPLVPALGSGGAATDRYQLHEAALRLLEAAASPELVLILEDLHWADADTLALAQRACDVCRGRPWLIVGTFRSAETPGLLDLLTELHRDAGYERIELTPFDAPDVARYLELALGRPPEDRTVHVFLEETGGNPFFVQELFRHLRDEGGIAFGRRGQVPGAIQDVVRQRASRLSADARRTLRFASTFFGSFDLELLGAITEREESRLLDAVEEAMDAGFLVVDPARRYSFAHTIVRRAFYDALKPDRRVRLHRRIALLLEKMGPAAPSAEIAAQYFESRALGDPETGVQYAMDAADQAQAVAAHDRAVSFLAMAAELAEDAVLEVRAYVLQKRALAEAHSLRFADALQSAKSASAAFAEIGTPPRERATFLATIAQVMAAGAAPVQFHAPLVEVAKTLAGGARDLLWARLELLAVRYTPRGRGAIAAGDWRPPDGEAVEIARSTGDEATYAATLNVFEPLDPVGAERLLERARTWKRPLPVCLALEVAAFTQLHRHADYAQAAATYAALSDAGARFGSPLARVKGLCGRASCDAMRGHIPRAQAALQRIPELLRRVGRAGHSITEVSLESAVVVAYLSGGAWDALAVETRRRLEAEEVTNTPNALVAAGLTLVSRVHAGEPSAALARDLFALLGEVEESIHRKVALHLLSLSVWTVEDTEMARPILEALLAAPEAGGAPLTSTTLEIGRMLALAGRTEEAVARLEEAERDFDRRGCAALAPIARLERGRAWLRGRAPERARGPITSALQVFRDLDMRPFAAAAEALLSQAMPERPSGLTERELDVLRLLASGLTNKEIAGRLYISASTVQRHVSNIYPKLGVHNRAEATALALARGLVPPA